MRSEELQGREEPAVQEILTLRMLPVRPKTNGEALFQSPHDSWDQLPLASVPVQAELPSRTASAFSSKPIGLASEPSHMAA